MTTESLRAEHLVDYLIGRSTLSSADGPFSVRELEGGVSGIVLRVDCPGGSFVVKQALARLKVADTWEAPPERTITEGRALAVFHDLTPLHTPRLVDLDEEQFIVTMTAAPGGARTLKQDLMSGIVDPEVAQILGATLALWHRPVAPEDELATRFAAAAAFRLLRLDPYFGPVMAARPQVAEALSTLVEDLAGRHLALVHGDFSPKNVILWPGGLWVLDFEVTHHGDPAFDLAFMLSHLSLKAIRSPEGREPLAAFARRFLQAYRQARAITDEARVAALVGALMLARALGKSPAEYLDAGGRVAAARCGQDLLFDPPDRLEDLWNPLR